MKLSLLFKDRNFSVRVEIYRDPINAVASGPIINRILSGFSSSFVEHSFSYRDEQFLIYGLTDIGVMFELWEVRGYDVCQVPGFSLSFLREFEMPVLFEINERLQVGIMQSAESGNFFSIDLKMMSCEQGDGLQLDIDGSHILLNGSLMITWGNGEIYTTVFSR
jgi:hypothetical protein